MKIISWNVNGIRAVERKGDLQTFLELSNPDILFLQEIKGKPEQFSPFLVDHAEYVQFYNSAEKPGYAGTGVWIKKSLFETEIAEHSLKFSTQMTGFEDTEGRIAHISFTHKISGKNIDMLGVYFPNGGKSSEAWDEKLVFYEKFLSFINALRNQGQTVFWTGDVNCAHNEIDLARPEENRKSIGFLPEERAWISTCIDQGWTDVFREKNPEKIVYSWWHVITRARSRNVGWRIDYFFCDEADFSDIKKIEYLTEQMGSDHCPVLLEI